MIFVYFYSFCFVLFLFCVLVFSFRIKLQNHAYHRNVIIIIKSLIADLFFYYIINNKNIYIISIRSLSLLLIYFCNLLRFSLSFYLVLFHSLKKTIKITKKKFRSQFIFITDLIRYDLKVIS